jgi:hypothetical protein
MDEGGVEDLMANVSPLSTSRATTRWTYVLNSIDPHTDPLPSVNGNAKLLTRKRKSDLEYYKKSTMIFSLVNFP